MELIKVDLSNAWEIIKLNVKESQKSFVASNSKSIIEAYATIQSGYIALPFGIFEDERYIGFVMLGYDTNGDEDEPDVVKHNYCIWRFMIDERYQGLGYGEKAMELVMKYIKIFREERLRNVGYHMSLRMKLRKLFMQNLDLKKMVICVGMK